VNYLVFTLLIPFDYEGFKTIVVKLKTRKGYWCKIRLDCNHLQIV